MFVWLQGHLSDTKCLHRSCTRIIHFCTSQNLLHDNVENAQNLSEFVSDIRTARTTPTSTHSEFLRIVQQNRRRDGYEDDARVQAIHSCRLDEVSSSKLANGQLYLLTQISTNYSRKTAKRPLIRIPKHQCRSLLLLLQRQNLQWPATRNVMNK